jgi:glutathione synthase/RimK-type ligase-like ATP-grasp enzyme
MERPLSGRALIVDQHTTYPIDVCRALARQGYLVDAAAEATAPVLRSRYCYRRYVMRPWYEIEPFLAELDAIVNGEAYDAIYMCSEEILQILPRILHRSPGWKALPLTRPHALPRLFSKNAALACMREAGVPVPRTIVPERDDDVAAAGRELGFPLVVKGEKGGASWNVRMVDRPDDLVPTYRMILARERGYAGRPALQEFIPGSSYLAGGLFHDGRALRLCAHRMVLMNPPRGGTTVKAVTERPAALVDTTLRAFEALEFTGLGEIDFIRDDRDGRFKFLEINPRVWASIGLARRAGVDLLTPYRDLARGLPVHADLRYREGVRFHRLSGELHLLRRRPSRLSGFVRDCLDPRISSDFEWTDLGPHFPTLFRVLPSPAPPPAVREAAAA